ncbi:MAG: adenylate/guanylate cyclase domain-containing protein [Austwickia sp.]|nr:adenylate/guanylate cyclase domain-containing protein [Austwickia sp.]MBK8436784.1 adenylate/guanylate cyclase domain-containing protein [Austwickia sp.]MBK9100413.1 adenylate/guanylate cyclase domain-containing protein [Austwickia sp.]
MTSTPPELPKIQGLADALLGESPRLSRGEVSAAAGVSVLSARRFWQALGFPLVGSRDAVFTEADAAALELVTSLVRSSGLDETTALAMTRAVARTTDQLAEWQTSLIAEYTSEEPELTHDVARRAAAHLLDLADDLEPLLVYAWRRHLVSSLAQLITQADPAEQDVVHRCVGFADMVDFTEAVRRMTERELGRLVQRFEELASDVVAAHGGRVVKTMGDAVVFSSDEPVHAGNIALDLVDVLSADRGTPQLRIGVGCGPVTSRLGDIFGTTVNRASRITALARPGTVIIDDPLARELSSHPDFTPKRLRPRSLRGLGLTSVWVLRRAPEAAAMHADRRG